MSITFYRANWNPRKPPPTSLVAQVKYCYRNASKVQRGQIRNYMQSVLSGKDGNK